MVLCVCYELNVCVTLELIYRNPKSWCDIRRRCLWELIRISETVRAEPLCMGLVPLLEATESLLPLSAKRGMQLALTCSVLIFLFLSFYRNYIKSLLYMIFFKKKFCFISTSLDLTDNTGN